MLTVGKSAFWRNVHPTGAIGDFVAVWRTAGKRRWPFVALALAMTTGVFYVIAGESWRGPPKRPSVVYINSWTANRSDAEIARTNAENQLLQDELRAEQAKRDAKIKDIYRTLGKVSGMDVARIEADAKADAAREKAAHDKAIGLTTAPAANAREANPVGQR
ncbi:hypothetical protein H7F51_10840 [Novosphingobium flavum]|uniref:Uncharacterized protein n=1 Tax=Novosphingobium flavum TaxID=1778672 RepID=A0A7X1FS99_9SPHN|nr:hypothetical protein [Novosphingobium flavum]MBC2666023.1 hypothetical protein [Novosphingobium flavum]